MKLLIISTCQEKLSEVEFVKPIVKIVENVSGKLESKLGTLEFDVRHYLEDVDFAVYDKIIICGTALYDNKFLEELDKFNWLQEVTAPVLGICAGFQVLGLQFGAKVVKKQEIGMVNVVNEKKNKLFSGEFFAYNLHGNGLDSETLDSFEVLAKSSQSIQAIKHKEKELYGIIFHPEVRNEEVVRKFL